MSDVEFEADIKGNPLYKARSQMQSGMKVTQFGQPKVGMVNWLVSHGIISSESGAKSFLIGLIMINFIATGLILYFFVLR